MIVGFTVGCSLGALLEAVIGPCPWRCHLASLTWQKFALAFSVKGDGFKFTVLLPRSMAAPAPFDVYLPRYHSSDLERRSLNATVPALRTLKK